MKKYKCSTCEKLIRNGMGYVQIAQADVLKHNSEQQAFTEKHPDSSSGLPSIISAKDLGDIPKPIKWYAVHTHCEASGAEFYAIPVEELRYPESILEWTSHLMEKDWITDTNWSQVLWAFANADSSATFYQRREYD